MPGMAPEWHPDAEAMKHMEGMRLAMVGPHAHAHPGVNGVGPHLAGCPGPAQGGMSLQTLLQAAKERDPSAPEDPNHPGQAAQLQHQHPHQYQHSQAIEGQPAGAEMTHQHMEYAQMGMPMGVAQAPPGKLMNFLGTLGTPTSADPNLPPGHTYLHVPNGMIPMHHMAHPHGFPTAHPQTSMAMPAEMAHAHASSVVGLQSQPPGTPNGVGIPMMHPGFGYFPGMTHFSG
jgi:hypothetical protein